MDQGGGSQERGPSFPVYLDFNELQIRIPSRMAETITEEMEAFRETLKKEGLAATRQRLQLAEIIFSTHQHFTADDLYDWTRKKGWNIGRVTAYRTLKLMVDANLVEERQFRKDRVVYEHVFGHHHHDHMVCTSCETIIEFESPAIEKEQNRIARKHGFEITSHSHTLKGHCKKCASKKK